MGNKMTIKAASEKLKLSEHFLRQSVRRGEIPFILAGSRYILDIDDVEEVLKKKSFDNMQRNSGRILNKYGTLRTIR